MGSRDKVPVFKITLLISVAFHVMTSTQEEGTLTAGQKMYRYHADTPSVSLNLLHGKHFIALVQSSAQAYAKNLLSSTNAMSGYTRPSRKEEIGTMTKDSPENDLSRGRKSVRELAEHRCKTQGLQFEEGSNEAATSSTHRLYNKRSVAETKGYYTEELLTNWTFQRSHPGLCEGNCGRRSDVPCACDVLCTLYKNCCPDFLQECPDVYQTAVERYLPELLNATIVCPPRSKFSMITSCPDGSVINDYKNLTSLFDALNGKEPVTSLTTGLVYASRSVFQCHEKENPFQSWHGYFNVEAGLFIPKTFEDMESHFITDNIEFSQPYIPQFSEPFIKTHPEFGAMGSARACSPNGVASCPPDYPHPQVRSQCESIFNMIELTVIYGASTYYKNAFCFVCNAHLYDLKKVVLKHLNNRMYYSSTNSRLNELGILMKFTERDGRWKLHASLVTSRAIKGRSLWSKVECDYSSADGGCDLKACYEKTVSPKDNCFKRKTIFIRLETRGLDPLTNEELEELHLRLACYLSQVKPDLYRTPSIIRQIKSTGTQVPVTELRDGAPVYYLSIPYGANSPGKAFVPPEWMTAIKDVLAAHWCHMSPSLNCRQQSDQPDDHTSNPTNNEQHEKTTNGPQETNQDAVNATSTSTSSPEIHLQVCINRDVHFFNGSFQDVCPSRVRRNSLVFHHGEVKVLPARVMSFNASWCAGFKGYESRSVSVTSGEQNEKEDLHAIIAIILCRLALILF